MGKWTLEHHDEVLRNKVKNMAQGAVRRMNAEGDKASITYEAFVEELNEGDSFTASLFDILVKEIAERRTRPHANDRQLISERTAKALQMQATPARVYRSSQSSLRNWPTRRHIPLPSRYTTSHDLVFADSDGEEDYGTALNTAGPIEGARINTDLHDAYFPSTYDLPGTLSRPNAGVEPSPSPSSPPVMPPEQIDANRVGRIPRLHSPPTSRSTWSTSAESSGSSLTRQPSLRRSFRTRTSDFNDFTTRRRSAIRNSATQEDGPRTDSADGESRPDVLESHRIPRFSTEDAIDTLSHNRQSTIQRRLAASAPSSSGNVGGYAEPPGATEFAGGSSNNAGPSSSQLWYSLTSPLGPLAAAPSVARPSAVMDISGERSLVAPRLRRGGLRPPELARHSGLPFLASVPSRTGSVRTLSPPFPTVPVPVTSVSPPPPEYSEPGVEMIWIERDY
ncbi:hypothetical protein BC628DRAFT_1347860 [Trametes gibbosa]|nr:hypothetical protein BC628DRAFT_1347860 [Trametes gibbosa]